MKSATSKNLDLANNTDFDGSPKKTSKGELAVSLQFQNPQNERAYKAWCMSRRLQRKIELLRAKKNRRRTILLSEIKGILDGKFLKYQEKHDKQSDKINEALEGVRAPVLPEEENRELKRLCRKIMRVLHPDLNPCIPEGE